MLRKHSWLDNCGADMRVNQGSLTRGDGRPVQPVKHKNNKAAVNEFLHNSTIHGFRELGRADGTCPRIFWTVIILLSAAAGSYEIYQIVNYYTGRPGATQISWNVKDTYDYPPIAFCPKRWLSMERARKLGLSDELLAYAVSLVQFDVVVRPDFDDDDARHKLREIMRRNNMSTYLDLIIGIGYEADNLLRLISTPSDIKLQPFVPSFGLCYLMEMQPVKATALRTTLLLRFAYRPPHRANATQLYDRRLQPHMLVRDSSGVKPNFVTFSQTAIYQIDFEAQVYRRISRPEKPCMDRLPSKDYHVGMCELICIYTEKDKRGCDACYNVGLMATLNMSMGPDSRPCSHYERRPPKKLKKREKALKTSAKSPPAIINSAGYQKSNDTEAMVHRTLKRRGKDIANRPLSTTTPAKAPEERLDAPCGELALAQATSSCTAQCKPPCEQWVYKHTTNMLSDEAGDEIVVWVAYNPIDGILWYEEVPTYTIDTFISNVGGQLGLWLGASIISIVQIIFYAFKFIANYTKRTLSSLKKRTSESTRQYRPKERLPLV